MKQRGRKSAASLAIVPIGSAIKRPTPPAELRLQEKAEWAKITEALPADWFPPESHALLAQLCRHILASKRVAALVAQHESQDTIDIIEYDRLLTMQEKQSRAISALSRSLRLTIQSRVRAETAGRRAEHYTGRKPWE